MSLTITQWRSKCDGVEPLPRIYNGGGLLPVDPLIPIIRADALHLHREHDEGAGARGRGEPIPGLDRLSRRTGVNIRSLHRWATHEADYIALDQADRYLCATGRHLADVWPWLYTPEQAAADVAAVEGVPSPDERRRIRNRDRQRALRNRPRAATA